MVYAFPYWVSAFSFPRQELELSLLMCTVQIAFLKSTSVSEINTQAVSWRVHRGRTAQAK